MKNYFNNIFHEGIYNEEHNCWLFKKEIVLNNIEKLDNLNFPLAGGDVFDNYENLIWSWEIDQRNNYHINLLDTVKYLNEVDWLSKYSYLSFHKRTIFSEKIDEVLMIGYFSKKINNWIFSIREYSKIIQLLKQLDNIYILGGDYYDDKEELIWSFSFTINTNIFLESLSQLEEELTKENVFKDIKYFSLSIIPSTNTTW